jgi:hypothetical protein
MGQAAAEMSNIPLLTNILRVLIFFMIAIQQNTSTLGGTIPLQIPVKEKLVSIRGLGLNSPHRDLTENLPEGFAFQTNLSSASLSRCTLERITVIWSRRPEFLPCKGLI